MQHPTLQNVRIRSTRDADQIFHCVATHRLLLITRRLDAEERRNIISGNVYVWEERGANTEPTGLGMERWTDGIGWGPSRVRDEFLFYHEKDSDMTDDLLNPVTSWAHMMRGQRRPPFSVDSGPVPEAERLVKQTYCVDVSLPADRPRGIIRKWHLTAYFSPQTLDELDTIDNLGPSDVAVPEGWFRSARIGRNRRDSPGHGTIPHSPEMPSQKSISLSTPVGSHRTKPAPIQTSTLCSSMSCPPSTVTNHNLPPDGLVPFEVLVRTVGPRRDPLDEQLLRQFSI